MRMKALRYYNQRDIRVESIERPVPHVGEVLIRVTDAGLCQTQINEFIEGPFIINKIPHPRTNLAIPLTAGHEFGGIVESVNNMEQDGHLIGKQVAVLPLLTCGDCYYCKIGKGNLCNTIAYYGLLGEHGGFAEYACIKTENIFPVANRDLLTLIEPILVAINACRKLDFSESNKTVCVLGAGTIGLAMGAVLKHYFHIDPVISDILPLRLRRAEKLGFRTVTKGSLTNAYHVVVDCAGSNPLSKESAILEGLGYLLKGGTLLSIGSYFHPISFVPVAMTLNEKNLISSFAYTESDLALLPDVLSSIRLDFSEIIERIPLARIVEDGYYRAEVAKDTFTRLVVVP